MVNSSHTRMNLIDRSAFRFASVPYVIAEIGVNHEGSIDMAKHLIELAKEGGAHAAKFQSYKAKTLASIHSPAYWDLSKEPTLNQFELFQKYDSFTSSDYLLLAEHCNKVGIDFLSTPFDDSAIEYLDTLVPFFKIASADLTNSPFLAKIGKKKKPVVLSTGCSTLEEIRSATDILIQSGCPEIALLHCVLNYPTRDEDAHLLMIRGLQSAFPTNLVGYSDHTIPDDGMTSLLTAFLLGAVILEKHFTHDKSLPGNDHYHSMDVADLRRLTLLLSKAKTLLGTVEEKQPLPSEDPARLNARRSIVVSRHVSAGTRLTPEMLTYKRPGTGISPTDWDKVMDQKVIVDLESDHVLQWEDLESGSR